MRRRLRRIAPIALIAAALPLGLPAAAEARTCRSFKEEGRKYLVSGSDTLGCRFMRKWSRRMARGEKGPRRWGCTRVSLGGSCTRGTGFNLKWFSYRSPS